MRRPGSVLIGAALLVVFGASSASADDIAVIVNRSTKMGGLTYAALQRIVLGQQPKWPNGQKIKIVLAGPGQPERSGVLQEVARMTDVEYNLHFVRAAAQGGAAEAPKTTTSSAEVKAWVAKTPGAVGFVRASDVDDSVNVVMIDGLLPGQAGYRISAK